MKYSHTAVSSLSILLLLLVGCGSSSQVGANANASSAGNTPNVAARATEPRTNDPTAAQSSPSTATTGVTATLSGEPPPSKGSDAKTAATEDTPKPFGATSASGASASNNAQKNEADLPKKIGARHVLVQWMGSQKAAASIVRSKEQAFAVVQDVLKRAKKGEDFARLAVEFSDEPGAGNRGGSLGRFGRGTMVPQFDQAAFRLDVGQVSEIVETPFGFHVIQRTE